MAAQRLAFLVALSATLLGCQPEQAPPGYAGIVEYDERRLGFELGGRLLERAVERGAEVKAGATLAKLDPSLEQLTADVRASEMKAAVAQTELVSASAKPEDLAALDARIKAARAVEQRLTTNLAREKTLVERGVTPAATVDDLERDLDQARAETASLVAQRASLQKGAKKQEVESARAREVTAEKSLELGEERVKRYALTAPVDGEIVAVHAETGETIAAGVPVVTLADTTRPVLEVFIPEGRVAGVKIGAPASVRVDGDPGQDGKPRSYQAVVEYVASRMEFSPRFLFSDEERPKLVLRVRLRITDPEHRLVAGMPAFATLP